MSPGVSYVKQHRRLALGVVVLGLLLVFGKYVFWSVALLVMMVVAGSKQHQLQQLESPDHVVAAVLVEVDPGLSIEPSFERLYLVQPTKSSNKQLLLLEGFHFEGLAISWKAPGLVEIEYSSGCISKFVNHATLLIRGEPYNVEARLKGPEDNAAHACY
jgi:hypothetical protein